jgi:cell division septal protein FtsQ
MKKTKKKAKRREPRKDTALRERMPVMVFGISVGFFLLAVIGFSVITYQILTRSDYFSVETSEVEWINRPLADKAYNSLRDVGVGENILKFDISSATEQMLSAYPEIRNIQIIRNFPDRLLLRVDARVPVAQVGERSFFLIDDEGVTLTDVRDEIIEGMPIIMGVRWKFLQKVGYKDDSTQVTRALALLKAVRESDFLNEHMLTRIDASDPRNITFFIEDGLEIKIGHSDFIERLDQLNKTLASMMIDRDQIEYIDLRFDDIVLGTR